MKKILTTMLALFFVGMVSFAQVKYDYYYRPEKQELETEISYLIEETVNVGARHNEEKDFFNPKADDNTITYFFMDFPIWDRLRFQPAIGTGYRRDIEFIIFYEYRWLYIEIGASETDPLFFEIKVAF